jgi:N-formylglutamate amidohydrolase
MKNKIFSFYSPHQLPLKGILSIPHSGEWIPEEFTPYLTVNTHDLNQDLNYQVNELVNIEQLTQQGIAVLVSHVHRVCIDLNRAPEQAIFAWKENTQGVSLVTKTAHEAFCEKALHRYHYPYFEMLRSVLDEGKKNRQSPLSVIDLHSMPSKPTAYHLKKNPQQKIVREDFCISDLKGKSCHPEYMNFAETLFTKDFSVSMNDPYLGGYVTQFFHQCGGNNALQIEINRKLYMDESSITLIQSKANFLKEKITKNLLEIFEHFQK